MMGRYIDIDILSKIVFDKWQECDELKQVIPAIRSAIMAASFDEVDTIKHGKWVEKEGQDWKYSKEYNCSVCGKYRLVTNPAGWEWNYCPNCGAKMDGE